MAHPAIWIAVEADYVDVILQLAVPDLICYASAEGIVIVKFAKQIEMSIGVIMMYRPEGLDNQVLSFLVVEACHADIFVLALGIRWERIVSFQASSNVFLINRIVQGNDLFCGQPGKGNYLLAHLLLLGYYPVSPSVREANKGQIYLVFCSAQIDIVPYDDSCPAKLCNENQTDVQVEE